MPKLSALSPQKIASLLGLAYRAKRVSLGEDVLDAFKKRKLELVLIAKDASEKTKARYLRKCAYYRIPWNNELDSSLLAQALGKVNVKVLAINDRGFVRLLAEKGGLIIHGQTTQKQESQENIQGE